ncbi:putative transporter YutK isoform X2 [Babylonia areolata]|uniref:putative transporter YutK isoform X2 n=1 Tax=Babylonia areolata TaxID=304850 RepID=UPI003FD3A872
MSEDRNSPESSRLLDTSVLTTTDLNHRDPHGCSLVEKKNGDVCHGGGRGEPAVCLEMETPTPTPHPPDSKPPPTTPKDAVAAACASAAEPPDSVHVVTDSGDNRHHHGDGGEDLVFEENCCTRTVERVHSAVQAHFRHRKRLVHRVVKVAVLLGYLVYFALAMRHRFGDEGSVTLLVLTLFGAGLWGGRWVVRRTQCMPLKKWAKQLRGTRKAGHLCVVLKWSSRIGAVVFITVFLMINVWTENPENLRSLLGIVAFIALLFCFSHNPSKVNWHTVFWAVVQQMTLGVLILRTSWGLMLFDWVGRAVKSFLDFGLAGARFLFGEESWKVHRLAIITVSIMVYFNAFIASLFHLGVVQAVISSFGRFLGHCLGTGPIESFAASANIFISLTETPLVLRPYLSKMTKAELHAVMTCGFASISGAVLGAYAQFGIPANHLLAASVMSAPAALAASRLMYPETKHSKFRNMDCTEIGDMRRRNLWEAVSRGAGHAGGLAMATLTNQLAFVALLALVNAVLRWFGDRVGVEDVTFKWVCSYLFYPVVYAMGTQASDCRTVASLLGIKLFGTPIMAYTELADLRTNRLRLEEYVAAGNATWDWQGEDVVLSLSNATLVGGVIAERSEVIALYMLCGISTITSIGVCLGVMLSLAEDRKEDITGMVVNTLVAGNFASFLTAAIAGLMISGKPLPT